MAAKTYDYECSAPLDGGEIVAAQMSLAHRYRNDLARVEHNRRATCEALLRERCPTLAAADATLTQAQQALEQIRGEMRQRNARARSRVSVLDDPTALREARRTLREARAELRRLRQEAYADGTLAADLADINARSQAENRRLRAESLLHWGTYQHVEEALAEAHREGPPSFRRWDGSGTVAVHFQPSIPAADLLGGGRADASLTPLPARGRHQSPLALLRLRVGHKSAPSWATAEVRYHRPLPAGASVSWVRLQRQRFGTALRWRCQLVLKVPDDCADCPEPKVGVDLGWRLLEDGSLRVASWVGSDGALGELRLPAALVERDALPDQLESHRDQHFNGVVAVLAAWLRGEAAPPYLQEHLAWVAQGTCRRQRPDALRHLTTELAIWEHLRQHWPATAPVIPDWLRERTETLTRWRAQAQLAGLTLCWRQRRFTGDEAIQPALEAWRRRDKHLCDWAAFQRLSVRRARRDLYRKFAATLARRYGVAFLEKINWRELLARPEPDQATQYGAIENAPLAAVGELVEYLAEEMPVVRLEPAYTTTDCHLCGQRCEWDQARELRHVCEGCGAEWDQDENAARNLLSRGRLVANVDNNTPRGPDDPDSSGVTAEPPRKSRRNRRSQRGRSQEDAQNES